MGLENSISILVRLLQKLSWKAINLLPLVIDICGLIDIPANRGGNGFGFGWYRHDAYRPSVIINQNTRSRNYNIETHLFFPLSLSISNSVAISMCTCSMGRYKFWFPVHEPKSFGFLYISQYPHSYWLYQHDCYIAISVVYESLWLLFMNHD